MSISTTPMTTRMTPMVYRIEILRLRPRCAGRPDPAGKLSTAWLLVDGRPQVDAAPECILGGERIAPGVATHSANNPAPDRLVSARLSQLPGAAIVNLAQRGGW
jgi:hypothetical protein